MRASFSMRAAQSGGFVSVIAFAILIETSGLHLLLATTHPLIAWALTLSSLWALWWIAIDHRALAHTMIRVDADTIAGEVGRRVAFSVPRPAIASVERPRLMPTSGPPAGYLNATKPASPNVLIVFRAPVTMRVFGMSKQVRQLALRLDDAGGFIEAGK